MPTPTRPTLTKLAEYDIRTGANERWEVRLDGTVTRTRRFVVLWAELPLVAKYFVGYSQVDGSGTGATLRRLTPMQHPDDPSFYAVGVSLINNHKPTQSRGANPTQPGGKPNPLADGSVATAFAKAMIEVTYARVMYRVLTDDEIMAGDGALSEADRFVELKGYEPAPAVFPLPGQVMKFWRATGTGPPNNSAVPYGIPMIVPGQRLKAVWRDLPTALLLFADAATVCSWQKRFQGDPDGSPPTRSYLGTINKTKLFGFPRWTLLLEGANPVPRVAANPLMGFLPISYDVELTWLFQPRRHNYFYFNYVQDPDDPITEPSGWYQVHRSGYVDPVSGTLADDMTTFDERDHRLMFQLGGTV